MVWQSEVVSQGKMRGHLLMTASSMVGQKKDGKGY